MNPSSDPTQRFTGRVEKYARYRPSYPKAVLDLLKTKCGLTSASVVADVGSGTGILSRLFLENGNRVFGIEPNEEMREASERSLGQHLRFMSVAGTAEATTLDDACVDFITAGQAFHWFDPERARAEFARILKPGGWVALIWNWRRKERTPLLVAYERLLEACRMDRGEAEIWRRGDEMASAFFGPGSFETASFDNKQVLDLDGFKGRLLSTSYVPAEDEPGSEAMLRDAEKIFREHQTSGKITVEYDTKVYYGQL